MITCLIVNLNCKNHVLNLINDLKQQTFKNFEVILIDQNSTEPETKKTFDDLSKKIDNIKVYYNDYNKPLNQIWNNVVKNSSSQFISFLNNDIRIPKNFLQDNIQIFNLENKVSCVIHPTNHPSYSSSINELKYKILKDKTRQGWDFSIRKKDWTPIPDCLDFYCGDDFIFENLYQKNLKIAMALSSPIIHLLSQTRKSPLNTSIPNRNPNKDIKNYKLLGYKHYLNILDEYSKLEPTIKEIQEYDE